MFLEVNVCSSRVDPSDIHVDGPRKKGPFPWVFRNALQVTDFVITPKQSKLVFQLIHQNLGF